MRNSLLLIISMTSILSSGMALADNVSTAKAPRVETLLADGVGSTRVPRVDTVLA